MADRASEKNFVPWQRDKVHVVRVVAPENQSWIVKWSVSGCSMSLEQKQTFVASSMNAVERPHWFTLRGNFDPPPVNGILDAPGWEELICHESSVLRNSDAVSMARRAMSSRLLTLTRFVTHTATRQG